MVDLIGEGKTPTIGLASSNRIIKPMDANHGWMIKTPQTDKSVACRCYQ